MGTTDNTKESGKMTYDMVKDSNGIRMATHIVVAMETAKLTEKAFIPGSIKKSTMVSGTKA